MKKRVMVIGPTNCGKTSLIDALTGKRPLQPSRQEVIYTERAIDVPGVYIENPWLHKRLIALSQEASKILFLLEKTGRAEVYPPGFASVFNCPVIGVITKANQVFGQRVVSLHQWQEIGIMPPVFEVDTTDHSGIIQLKNYLFQNSSKGVKR